MTIDWGVAVATIAAPIITLFVAKRWLESSALISFFGHVAAFRAMPPSGQPFTVHTHAVVLRNTGRRSATNVRLRHYVLPDFVIWPAVQHRVEALPNGGGREIVIPTLVPGQQIIVSYLYFPPLTFQQINAGIHSDEGFARAIPVLLQRVYPIWFNRTLVALVLIGIGSVVYIACQLTLRFIGK